MERKEVLLRQLIDRLEAMEAELRAAGEELGTFEHDQDRFIGERLKCYAKDVRSIQNRVNLYLRVEDHE